MTYNWQQPDWPNFRYDLSFVEDLLFDFAEKTGHIAGLLQGLPDNAQQEIILSLMVSEAVKTSEIEGEFIQRSDVMSSIRNNLGLSPAHEEVGDKKAQGVGELMVAVRQSFAAPLTETMLFDWHSRLMAPFVKRLIVGQWRSHEDPMQIVSGPLGKQRVHFEAPSSSDVPKEMAGRPRKLSATPDLSGTVLPLCPIPNSASKSAPSFNSVKLKASACAALLA